MTSGTGEPVPAASTPPGPGASGGTAGGPPVGTAGPAGGPPVGTAGPAGGGTPKEAGATACGPPEGTAEGTAGNGGAHRRDRTGYLILPAGIDDPLNPSGGNRYDRCAARALVAAGWLLHEITVAGPWPRPGPPGRAELARVLAGLPEGSIALLDGLVASAVPEIVSSAAGRLRLAILLHLPLADETGLDPHTASRLDALERRALRSAAAVVATSRSTRRRLVDHHGLDPRRVHVAAPGVTARPLAPGSGGAGRLLCVASLTPRKGQDVLIEALARCADLTWSCELVGGVGPDPGYADRLRRLARSHGIAGRVHFAGPLAGPLLDAAFAAADLLVLPSHAETYGMVVTEALAAGVPVLASAVGGVPEALGTVGEEPETPGTVGEEPETPGTVGGEPETPGTVGGEPETPGTVGEEPETPGTIRAGTVPGLLVPPADPAALAGALRRWLTDPATRQRLRLAARQRRAALPSWDATAGVLGEVLSALGARTSPDLPGAPGTPDRPDTTNQSDKPYQPDTPDGPGGAAERAGCRAGPGRAKDGGDDGRWMDVTEPAGARPGDAQPAGTQSTRRQPADTQPAHTQPADTQSTRTQPADTQPAEAISASGYSPDWLGLREPADAAARAGELLDPLRRALAGRRTAGPLVIHDLGCGTGSMGRWLSGRLPGPQHWLLVDRDPELLRHAGSTMAARSADGCPVTVQTRQGDVTRLTAAELAGAGLVTASALLDLLTEAEVRRLAGACAAHSCPALLTLSVRGRVRLTPDDPLDAAFAAAFNAHQHRRTGGRRLLGPDALTATAEAFTRAGAAVQVRPSPWQLGARQSALVVEWLRGWLAAAVDQQPELARQRDYLNRRLAAARAGRLGVVVEHGDLLAAFD